MQLVTFPFSGFSVDEQDLKHGVVKMLIHFDGQRQTDKKKRKARQRDSKIFLHQGTDGKETKLQH